MRRVLILACAAAVLAGCVTRESANVYGRDEAGREQLVRNGTVLAVRKLRDASLFERWILGKEMLEITAGLESGGTRVVAQEADLELRPGERVRLLEYASRTRVTR